MYIDDLTIGEMCVPVWTIGAAYLIRTVTFIYVGKLVNISEKELVLSDASWIADTGRFYNMLKDGIESQPSSEIEPYLSEVIVSRGALIDATLYKHKLPSGQK